MIVYKITNTINDKGYVGQTTKSLNRRWIQHICEAFSERGAYLHKAIHKYMPDAFTIEVLQVCVNKEALDACEKFWIAQLGTKAPNGYNLTDGGEGTLGSVVSDQVRAQISASLQRNWQDSDYRTKLRTKLSAASKAKWQDPEYRAAHCGDNNVAKRPEVREKQRLAHRGNKSRLGKVHTAATRAKIGAASKGHKMPATNRAKLLAVNTGRKASSETLLRQSAARHLWWSRKHAWPFTIRPAVQDLAAIGGRGLRS